VPGSERNPSGNAALSSRAGQGGGRVGQGGDRVRSVAVQEAPGGKMEHGPVCAPPR
jgi:hypothetical protein